MQYATKKTGKNTQSLYSKKIKKKRTWCTYNRYKDFNN